MDQVIEVTQKLLRGGCKVSEVEVEARIRRQLIDKHSVQRLIYGFDGWKIQKYSEQKKISKTNRKCTYRLRDGVTICKSSISKSDVNDMWCAVHVSVETPVPSMQHILEAVPEIEVTRHQITLDGHLVDVILAEGEHARVEVEACAADDLDPEQMMRVVRRVCAVLQGNTTFVGYYDWKTVVHVTSTSFGPFCIDKKRYQKPRTMTVDVLFEIARDTKSWVVTPKVDGTRRFVVAFNGRAYSVDAAKNVSYEGDFSREKLTILDCEMTADGTYYAFDVPVFDSEYCGDSSFDERMSLLDDVLRQYVFSIHVVAKPYEKFGSFDRLHRLYEAFSTKKEFDIDGLIFANTTTDYMQPVPKWKDQSTVDLEVDDNRLFTCDGFEIDITHAELPEGSFGVWEFMFDQSKLIAKRSRPDKPQANSKHIVEKNIFDSVPGTLFTGKGFYLMRKYHNRVKRQVITDAKDVGATFLDIGTGQGGDLRKWNRALHVFCVEPNLDSLREMRDRCDDDMWAKITPINARLADVDPDAIDKKIDIFTVFFCMNQFENDDWEKLEHLVETKGSKHCRLLAIAITNPKEHKSPNLELAILGNDRYNIKMHDTRIMDINETTVNVVRTDEIMKRCEMRSAKQHILDSNDFMTLDERRLSSMYTLFIYVKK